MFHRESEGEATLTSEARKMALEPSFTDTTCQTIVLDPLVEAEIVIMAEMVEVLG